VRRVDFVLSVGSGEEEGRERKRRGKKENRRSSQDDRMRRKKSKHSDRDKGNDLRSFFL
jgi:hypothetical protein